MKRVLSACIAAVLTATLWGATPAGGPTERRYASDRVLVRLEQRLAAARPLLEPLLGELGIVRIEPVLRVSATRGRRSRHRLERLYEFFVPSGSDVEAISRRLSAADGVDFAEPDYVDRLSGTQFPNDFSFPGQWAFHQTSDADVDAPEAWAITTGRPLAIAVLDSGIDVDHPDLVANTGPGYDFVNDDTIPNDDHFHGTQVASVAAATTDNFVGMAGTCWNCVLMPLKVADGDGDIQVSDFIDAIVWAADHGAAVVNYSAGGPDHSLARLLAVQYAYDAGVVIVPAVGNTGSGVGFPARYRETIAVGASTATDTRWESSGSGRHLDVLAPGVDILVANRFGGFTTNLGTSLATPLVAGLVGLIGSVHPSAGREETRHLIWSGAQDQVGLPDEDTPGWDSLHGFGRVNMERTLEGALSSQSLRVSGKQATLLTLDLPNPLADSYDFIRGDLANVTETAAGVDLGAAECLVNDTPDPDTTGNEDHALPDPGHGFFYLARFKADSRPGSYGGSSRHRDRLPQASPSAAAWVQPGAAGLAEMGVSVAGAGDVNGDGFDDVIVGAAVESTATGTGAAYVYHGSPAGLGATVAWTLESAQTGSRLGQSVTSAGDVNNDGFDDVIVGEPRYDHAPGADQGRVLLFLGSASGLGSIPDQVLDDPNENARFGTRVRAAGDVNGDGFDDVIVGAPNHSNGQDQEGRAYLYLGEDRGLRDPAWIFESDQENARAGTGVGGAGDVDGDGFDDLIVGAPSYDNGEENEGRAWLFLGSAFGPSTMPSTILEIDVEDARFGSDTSTAGDLDGDDDDEVVIVAFRYADGETQEGASFVFDGSPAGLSTTPAWSFETDQWFTQLRSARSAGDVDGDGFGDLIVGSEFYHRTHHDEGRAWVFGGSASGIATIPAWSEGGGQRFAGFGRRTAAAGDVNGDGFDDVIVGAHTFDGADYDEGRVFVYLGGASGLSATPLVGCD